MMMNERTKELAEQAGARFFNTLGAWMLGDEELERFAELVRQDEREKIKREQQACYVDSSKYRNQR